MYVRMYVVGLLDGEEVCGHCQNIGLFSWSEEEIVYFERRERPFATVLRLIRLIVRRGWRCETFCILLRFWDTSPKDYIRNS